MRLTLAAAAAASAPAPRRGGRADLPRARRSPGRSPRSRRGRSRRTRSARRSSCDFKTIQAAVNKAKAGDKIVVRKGVYKEAVASAARQALPADRRRPQARPRRARGLRPRSRTASSSTGPTRSRSTASRPQLQGQRLLRHQRGRLQAHAPRGRQSGVYGIYAFNSKGGEMSHSEAYDESTRASTSGRRRSRPSRCARSCATSPAGNPIGFTARTCAT